MREAGAPRSIIRSGISVKRWMEALPSVEALRPASCPTCGEPGRPAGRGLGIRGHGRRERQQRGPLAPGERPTLVILLVRRYLCRCGASMTVAPQETRSHRLYTASAIGWALALFGIARLSACAIRARTSPWAILGKRADEGWATLRRWVAAIRASQIFPCVRASPTDFTARQVAERAATTLAAHAPPTGSSNEITARAFVGAALVW